MFKKKLIAMFMVGSLLIGTMASSAFAAPDIAQSSAYNKVQAYTAVQSVDNYETWLKEKTNNSGKELAQYQKLTKDQKTKFAGYLKKTDLLTSAFFSSLKPGESKKFANGDIVVTLTETNEADTSAQPDSVSAMATSYRKATYNRIVSLFGVDIFKATSYVNYSHDGAKILAIQGSKHFTALNYNPLLVCEWGSPTTWKTTTTAYSAADCSFGTTIEGYGVTYGSGEFGVWGNVKNEVGGWVDEY